ncbi:monoacylglycerol lipase ABHD6-like [Hydractinia symbiolongicarpus]|uniref:monoacylglycerol lipase ABHD6-like n=1 Tax=Hydractinia symbiolongicarpus TaxID=13093 RepID=UPI0025507292|nr:monoacylglycerol lipase ABHD6-like [Hydractinia symbiolongicarpus]
MEDLIFNAVLTAITICILIITLLWFMPHLIITIFVRVAVIFSKFKEKNVCVKGNTYCSYIERGNIDSTKKSILFIHGFFGSAVDFVQIAPYFDKSYHLVAIDMYNHGGTTSLNRNVTMEDMVVLVKTFSEKTDLHRRKFHLVGFSMGGSVAVDYASQYSEDVASLTLMGTTGMQVNYMSGKKPKSVVFTSDEDLLNTLDYLSSGKLSHPPKAITTALRYYKNRKASDVDYVLNGTVYDYKFSEANLKSISHLDVLILWGDEDLICPKQGMDFLKSRLPRATDVLIKNCGHVMLLSHIKEVAEHLKRWMDSRENDDEKTVPHKSSNVVLKSPY